MNVIVNCFTRIDYALFVTHHWESDRRLMSSLGKDLTGAKTPKTTERLNLIREIFQKLVLRFPKNDMKCAHVKQILTNFTQITTINESKLPFSQVPQLKGLDGKQIVEELIKNPACKYLKYADFTGICGFDNECLQKLTIHCPDLTHLNLNGMEGKIAGDEIPSKYPKAAMLRHFLV